MEESKTSTTINSALEIIKMDNESADSKLTKEELIKKLKGHLKFSYYLFYFVRMFGYVSLIASVSPDLADKLLKSINPKNLNEINNSFNDLKEIDLGKDLIAKNAEYGNIICRTVIECSQTMKIHNDKLKEGLEELIDRYAFNTYSNIIFEEININNENNYRSEFNAISDDDDISMDEDEKNKIMDKLNEDIQDLKRKSSIEAFNTESQIIDDIKKNEMRSHIKTIRNALDENIYNELIKKSTSQYSTFKEFIDYNHVFIMEEKEKEIIQKNVIDFRSELNNLQQTQFNNNFNTITSQYQNNVGFDCLNDDDKNLFILNET
ncbi:3597_t:CDS:2, partial [Rhizophagus irregularis]